MAWSLVLENLPRQQPGSFEKPNLKRPVKREYWPANPAGVPQTNYAGGEKRREEAWSEKAIERWRARSWEVRGHPHSLTHQPWMAPPE